MTTKTSVPGSPARRRAQWLRVIAIAILLAGFFGGIEIYDRGLRSQNLMDDPEMLGFNRQEARQMGLLYGNQGRMIMEFEDAMSQPKTQAIVVFVAAALIAGGCWYVARVINSDR